MKSPFAQLLVRWMVLALGVVIATRLVNGIHCSDAGSLVAAVLLLSFFNAILRPVLLLFTLPFIIFTMGLGVIVINAILFLFVGHIVQGFTVDGFWPAVWGSIVLSLTNLFMNAFLRSSRTPPPAPPAKGPGPGGGDVIDI
ncbi:MAG TPA: phage holin family protein [Opitutaceae bacterium]